MEMTFKYNIYKRWFPILLAPVFVLLAYVFIRAAYQIDNTIYGLLFLSVSILIAAFWFWIIRQCRTEIIVNQKGIKIYKPINSMEIEWKDITEYGRDRILAGYKGMWRYYIRCVHNKQKIIICQEDIINFSILDNFINKKYPVKSK